MCLGGTGGVRRNAVRMSVEFIAIETYVSYRYINKAAISHFPTSTNPFRLAIVVCFC